MVTHSKNPLSRNFVMSQPLSAPIMEAALEAEELAQLEEVAAEAVQERWQLGTALPFLLGPGELMKIGAPTIQVACKK